jgi:plastocyanin
MRRLRARGKVLPAVAAALGVALWAAPGALAATIVGAAGNRFTPADVTMAQGERLTFVNQDPIATHNVVSVDSGSDGKPLFGTEIIPGGQERFVDGSQYLTTGQYPYYCAVHPSNMRGTLHVSTAGTPVPRQTTLDVSLAILDGRLSTVRRRGALRARTTVSGASSVRLTASTRIRGRGVTLARANATFADGSARTVRLRLTRSAKSVLRQRRTARVTVRATATGSAGTARASASKTLRR